MGSSSVGLPEFVNDLKSTLAEVNRIGGVWRATRFDAYLAVLEEAASLSYPRPFPWDDDRRKQRTFFEAASQCRQLTDGIDVLRAAPPDVALERIQRTMKGDPLPPEGPDAVDDARNTLFELATAAALRRAGFGVEVPRAGEDLRATYAGLMPFLVECKRPAHEGSLLKNLKKARHQLKARRDPVRNYGLAIIGIDRIIGLSGEMPVVESEAAARPAIETTLMLHRKKIAEVQELTSEKLFPHATVVGVLLLGAIFPVDRGGIFTMSLLRLFCAGPETHQTSLRIARAFSASMPVARL